MPAATEQLEVVLADHHPALRGGVRASLEARRVRVVDESASAHTALDAISRLRPDAAVVDVQLPDMDAVELIAQMRDHGDDTPLVVMSEHDDAAVVERCMRAGANAFVAKQSQLDVLLDAIDAVVEGRRFVDPAVASTLLDGRDATRLSERELEVLQLMSDGQQNKQIARTLSLGEETVKSHVTSIMRHLGAASRTHAVAIALRGRLVR